MSELTREQKIELYGKSKEYPPPVANVLINDMTQEEFRSVPVRRMPWKLTVHDLFKLSKDEAEELAQFIVKISLLHRPEPRLHDDIFITRQPGDLTSNTDFPHLESALITKGPLLDEIRSYDKIIVETPVQSKDF